VLTGPEKAVLFLLSLDEAVAAPIVRELGEQDLKKLRAVASMMRAVPATAVDETFREFVDRASAAVAVPRGGLAYLRRLSVGALGEEAARAVFEESTTPPLARLEAAPAPAVAALLAREPAPVAGAILARLHAGAAAEILALLPADRQPAVVEHVGRMTDLPATVLEDMAAALAAELPSDDAAALVSVDGVARAAEILNATGRDVSLELLARVEELDKNLASDVRKAMFTFEDIARVDSRSMREILREVPQDRLVVALKGAPPDVLAAVMAGMSTRAADMLKDDLAILQKVKKSEAQAARATVVDVALRLETEGRVDLGREEPES